MRRVVEEGVAAEIADDGGARVDADAGDADLHALGRAFGDELLAEDVHFECAAHGANGVVRLVDGGVEEADDGIADDLVEGGAVPEKDAQHAFQVRVEQGNHHLRLGALGEIGEAGEVGEEVGQYPPLAAHRQFRRVGDQAFDDGR